MTMAIKTVGVALGDSFFALFEDTTIGLHAGQGSAPAAFSCLLSFAHLTVESAMMSHPLAIDGDMHASCLAADASVEPPEVR